MAAKRCEFVPPQIFHPFGFARQLQRRLEESRSPQPLLPFPLLAARARLSVEGGSSGA